MMNLATEYYAMSKVLATFGDYVYYVFADSRSKVVQVDLGAESYPESIITFPQDDLFQVVHDGHSRLVGIGEYSGKVAFYDTIRQQFAGVIELSKDGIAGQVYRTLDSCSGVTVVNSVKNSGFETENEQILIDRELQIVARHRISFDGGNLGKYIHKIKVAFLDSTGLPVIGMISHHHEDANFYLFGIDSEKQFIPLASFERLHQSRQS